MSSHIQPIPAARTAQAEGQRRGGRRVRRLAGWGLALVLALVAATGLAGAVARSALARRYPPPGQLIDVGGHRLHINCMGQGDTTVVLEAGSGDFSLQWARVQPAVASFARVCAYDRAGLGWSDPAPGPRTSGQMVEELHTLLERAAITGPYLLVGHSLGGVNVRLFAHRYPQEVAGLVLVDPAHEEQIVRVPALRQAVRQAPSQLCPLAWLNAAGIMALAPNSIPDRGLPAEAHDPYRAMVATTDYFSAAAAEIAAMEGGFAEVRAHAPLALGDTPLVVLSRGLSDPLPGLPDIENVQYHQEWQHMQAELAALSAKSTHMIAEESGHYIQLQQPELVVDAIRSLLQPQR